MIIIENLLRSDVHLADINRTIPGLSECTFGDEAEIRIRSSKQFWAAVGSGYLKVSEYYTEGSVQGHIALSIGQIEPGAKPQEGLPSQGNREVKRPIRLISNA